MFKNQTSILDDKGFNQGFKDTFAQRRRIERRSNWIVQEMEGSSEKKVLEIGCGMGYLAYCLAQKTKMQVVAIDKYAQFIEMAKERYQFPNLTYKISEVEEIKEKVEDKFDYIIGNGILHHLYYRLDAVLLILYQLLNPGGKILFMEPNIYNPYIAGIFRNKFLRRWARLDPQEMAFSKAFIRKKLEEATFKNIRIEYKDFLLPGIPRLLVQPSILMSNLFEKTPLKYISQSLFIHAQKIKSL